MKGATAAAVLSKFTIHFTCVCVPATAVFVLMMLSHENELIAWIAQFILAIVLDDWLVPWVERQYVRFLKHQKMEKDT